MRHRMSAISTASEPVTASADDQRAGNLINKLRRLSWNERVLIVIFLLTLPVVNPYIRGDGNEYYAYIRSLVIDGDLHFENEYRHGDPAFLRAAFDENGVLLPNHGPGDGLLGLMPNGYVHNPASVGPSLLWAPFFLAAHALVLILNKLGMHIAADGYSAPYRWFGALGTAIYAFIGLLLAYRLTSKLTDKMNALIATVVIWFASSLPVYMYFLPFHAPAVSSFAVALFLWYWLRTRVGRTLGGWVLWGITGGLMVEMYYLNGVFLLVALLEWGRDWLAKENRQLHSAFRLMSCGIVFALSVIVAMLPNFIAKGIIYGTPLASGYSLNWFFWTDPRLFEVGFSTEHGMFLWTPVLLLAVIGLVLLWRYDKRLAGSLLLAFALFYYAVAAFVNWHGNSSFGSRFFVSFTSVFIIGLAIFLKESTAFLSRLINRKVIEHSSSAGRSVRLALAAAMTLLILWNIGFIFQWGTNLVPNRGPVDFALMARNQVTVVPKKMANFIFHYLKSREQTSHEIESQDLKEIPNYDLKR